MIAQEPPPDYEINRIPRAERRYDEDSAPLVCLLFGAVVGAIMGALVMWVVM